MTGRLVTTGTICRGQSILSRVGLWPVLAVLWVLGCRSFLGTGTTAASPQEMGSLGAETGQARSEVVALEVSGRFERGPATGQEAESLGFREQVELKRGRTLLLTAAPVGPERSTMAAELRSTVALEVTSGVFGPDSVALDFKVFAVDESTGKRTLVASPKMIAPYGTVSEIQELHTASAGAPVSRLRLSVLPSRPAARRAVTPGPGLPANGAHP